MCAASAAHFLFYRDNKMDVKVIDWAEKEKVQMFDKIAEMYFNKKFGTFSEADSDLLLFNFYSEKKNQGKLRLG